MVEIRACGGRHASPRTAAGFGYSLPPLPAAHDFRERLGRSVVGEAAEIAPEDLARLGAGRIAGVVTLGLVELGFTLDAAPGEHVTLARGLHVIHPFEILLDAARGDRCIDDLRTACAAAGVIDLDLGAAAQRATRTQSEA